MDRAALFNHILSKRSYLCVGLDTDPDKIPSSLHTSPDPVLAFNKAIIEATQKYCVAYKINTAFYEVMGPKGWEYLQQTIAMIPQDHFIIADAKRGDIGNTSAQYARAFFDTLRADALTVAPYMGADSVKPFLEIPGKWAILLALTSNKGSADFQLMPVGRGGRPLYEEVIRTSMQWGTPDQLMYVVGATRADQFEQIRKISPDHFLLVPGVGAQGGDLEQVSMAGMNAQCGLLVNASRSILYASVSGNFAEAAALEAQKMQEAMDRLLVQYLKA